MTSLSRCKVIGTVAAAGAIALGVVLQAMPAGASTITVPGPNGTTITQPASGKATSPLSGQTVYEAEWAYETNSSYPGTDAGVEELWYNTGDRAVQATDTSYIGASSGENIVWRSDGTQVNCEFYANPSCSTSWLYDGGYTSYAEGFIDYLNTNFLGTTASF